MRKSLNFLRLYRANFALSGEKLTESEKVPVFFNDYEFVHDMSFTVRD
jgi:hypothetical protein